MSGTDYNHIVVEVHSSFYSFDSGAKIRKNGGMVNTKRSV